MTLDFIWGTKFDLLLCIFGLLIFWKSSHLYLSVDCTIPLLFHALSLCSVYLNFLSNICFQWYGFKYILIFPLYLIHTNMHTDFYYYMYSYPLSMIKMNILLHKCCLIRLSLFGCHILKKTFFLLCKDLLAHSLSDAKIICIFFQMSI